MGDCGSEAASHKDELLREAGVMSLYISIVLLAAVTSLPDQFGAVEDRGLSRVLLTIWGTTIGLALAHWFAFNVASLGFRGGKVLRHDLEIAVAQMAGAATVAAAATVSALLIRDEYDVDGAVLGPLLVLGIAGYLVAHWSGRSKGVSILAAVIVVGIGVVIAGVKVWLGAH